MFYFYFFRLFAHIFCFKRFSFFNSGRKNMSCSREQDILATSLGSQLHKYTFF